jgi:hypothetical protein
VLSHYCNQLLANCDYEIESLALIDFLLDYFWHRLSTIP